MGKRLIAILFIFFGVALGWIILGGTVQSRTTSQDSSLRLEVGQLWGSSQSQTAPQISYQTIEQKQVQGQKPGTIFTETKIHRVPLEKSDIKVDLALDYRKKGLLWYSTYRVRFAGDYKIVNNTGAERTLFVDFIFPNPDAIYDDFKFKVGNQEIGDLQVVNGKVSAPVKLASGESQTIHIAYVTQGMDEWLYDFGGNVNQVKNFSLVMNTDFKEIDFPANSISPTKKTESEQGWQCQWQYSNLLTGVKVGMAMPKKLNPGPWVATISYFAPVSLFLFLFMVIIFSVMKGVKIHPVNYFFVCAAYFSFHLLLAYLVDHISIHLAFLICSIVSIFLVTSYMKIVVGSRFAFLEVGISQFIFLVLFSYTFFFQGYTGLVVTILCILTLFVAMQLTARVKWEEVFGSEAHKAEKLSEQ